MNEEVINDLYNNAVSKGYKKSREEFVSLLQSNDAVMNDMYSYVQSKGYKKGIDDFKGLIGANVESPMAVQPKKKEDSTALPSGVGSSASSASTPDPEALRFAELVKKQGQVVGKRRDEPGYVDPRKTLGMYPTKEQADKATAQAMADISASKGMTPEFKEKDFFEGGFGTALRTFDTYSPIPFGEAIDDTARTLASGYAQGQLASAANDLILSGPIPDDETIEKLLEYSKMAKELGPSDSFINYQKKSEEAGGGFFGFFRGVLDNPAVLPELIVNSLTAMATNKEAVLAGSGAVLTNALATAAAAGTPTAGVGAAPGFVAGAASALPVAMGLASGILTTGATFSELLQQELGTDEFGNPIEPTKENTKAILEDPEKFNRIRNKSILKGATVGAIDFFTGKLASSVGAKILSKSAAKSVTGEATRTAYTKSVGAGSTIESTGGAFGEFAGTGIAGEKQNLENILFEAVTEMPMGALSTAQARLAAPVYKVNNKKVTAEQLDEIIDTMEPDDLAVAKIEVENDYEGRKKRMQDKIVTGSIANEVRAAQPDLNEPTVNAIVELQKELNKLEGNKTQVAKDKAAQIRAEIKNLQENQLPEQSISETVVAEAPEAVQKRAARVSEIESIIANDEATTFTEADRARKQELEEGIASARDRGITIGENLTNELETLNKKEQDAIQEQAAGQVPVQPGTGVSQEVAQGEPQAEPQGVTQQGQVQEEVVPTQELDLDGEVSFLEQLLAQEETAPTKAAGISISSEADVNDLRNRTQSRSQQATTKEEKESANTRIKIIDTAKKAINTLKSVFPDVDIVIHDDEGSYNAAMSEIDGVAGSRGNFFIDTTPDGKTTGRIDINLSKANSRTVAHEIGHGILLKTFGDNKNLFNDFRTRMSKVLKGDVNQELNDFANQYVDPVTGELLDVNHEEFLAELTGILEQQEANVSVTTMQKIAALINEFVSKITGGKFKPFEDTKNTKDVVDFFNTVSSSIREGSEIQKLNIQEPYSSGVAIPVSNPQEFVGKKFRSQLEIGDYKFPSNIDILRIANLPIKTLTELVRQYEGRVVIITSDATGYGVDRNGEPILGGFGFASNEKNVNDGIGFASVSTGTVKGTYTAAEKAYGTGKTLVLVMIQPPNTTINNSYGAKYIIRGLKEIAVSSKEELSKTKESIKTFIKGSTSIQDELKKTKGLEKRLFDLIDSIDENTNLDEAVKEFLNDTTFTIRKELGQGILFRNKDIRADSSTTYSKIAFNNIGYNLYDFLKEYGDNTILTDDLILNDIGGYVVGGFELDVLPNDQREALIDDIQNKGIVHPLFNAKLPGTNHFRLDALYDVEENFAQYAVPDTQISLSKEERDALVRELYKDDKFYLAKNRSIPLEKRTYTNLTVAAKTEFKNNYLKPRGLLVETAPKVSTKVARGEGFIPKEGAAEQIAKGTFVSRSQLVGNDAQRIVNLGRANGLSEQAISTVLQKRGFTQEAIDAALGKAEPAAKKVEVTEEFAPGYDRVLNEIFGKDGIVAKSRRRGRSEEEAMQNAIDYLQQDTKVYENATDVQREAMVRNLRKEFNKREKAAPSAEKVVGKPKKKEVTVDEMAALKDQIKLEARAAREAKGDLNTKRKALADKVSALEGKGTVTANQVKSIVKRIERTNLDNPIMVDRLLAYIEKVFDNANYAADMAELRKLQKQARSRNHTSMTNVVNQFTSINPETIPLDRIQDYKEALDFLNNRTPFYGNMNDIFDEMLSYQISEEFDAIKTMDALEKKYEDIMSNQVKNVEDYVNLIKDINSFKRKAFQLLQNEEITQGQYDELIQMVGKDQQTIEENYKDEITKIKKDLIAEIKNQRPKVSREFSNVENDLIRKYLELSDADLQNLSPEDLFVLNDLLENISNGEIDNFRFNEIISKAYTSDGANRLAKQIDDSKFDMTPEEGTKELSEYESSFWEGLLGMGRAKSGALQKFVVSVFNRAIASYENLTRDGYNKFLKIKDKYKMSDKDMHKIGMLTTYLQEYMAQFDPKNEGIKDIGNRDWFKEILNSKSMRGKYSSGKPSILKVVGLGKSEIDIIEEIWDSLPKDSNGNVNPKAVYDSYMANDGKFFTKNQKGFFDDIMDYKSSEITPKQKFANEINGASFKEIPFHMMRVRLDGGRTQITPTASSDNGVVRIKAGTGKERVSEAVGPIMTNFEKLFITNLEQTGRDYFLSGALKDINNTLSGAKKKIDPDKMPLLDTISGTLSEALGYEFDRTQSNFIFRNLLSARAATTLLRPIRTVAELGSTLLSYPVRAKTLSGYKSLFGEQGAMKKLLEFTNSPMLLRDNINKAIDINDGRIKPQSRFTKATNYLSGLPERTMMITSWMPTFKSDFKNSTGIDFDINKFNTSEAYREKYGKAIREASAAADAQTEKIIGPTTKAGQRREVRIAPKVLANIIGLEGTVPKNSAAGQILGFFSNYPYREVTEFINGFKEAAEVIKDEGALSSLSQLQKPLGIALNVAAYGFIGSLTYAGQLILLGDDEDEERGIKLLKDIMTTEGLLNELASNAISLAGSKYAAGGKALLQLAATIAIESTDDEEQKAKIKKLLKDSVFVDPLPVEQAAKFGGREKALSAIGMYIPQFVIFADRYADFMGGINEVAAIYDKVESKGVESLTQDEGTKILALNTIINASQILLNVFGGTSLPEYNNIKTYMKKLKEEAGVADVYKGEAPAKKKSSGGGGGGGGRAKTMNKSDLKRYFPEQYNELYGEGSATYEIEQEVKAFEKEQREMKKKIKDQVYGD